MTDINCSGALIYAKNTNRVLVLQKRDGKHSKTWGLVGGTNLDAETPWDGLLREINEEIGSTINFIKVIPLERFVSHDSKFSFRTYFCIIENEFLPILSDEHIGYAWADLNDLPKPLHQGLGLSLKNKVIQTKIQTIIEILDLL